MTTCSGKVYTNVYKNRDWQLVPESFARMYIKQLLTACSGKVYMNLHKNRDSQHVLEMFARTYIKTVITNRFWKGLHEFTSKPCLTTCSRKVYTNLHKNRDSGKVYTNLHKNRDSQHVLEMFARTYIKTVITNMLWKGLHEFI